MSEEQSDLFGLWSKIWDKLIVEQSELKYICFHNLISTILNEREEDYRLHYLIVSDSGSGKTESVELINFILTESGFNSLKCSSTTDAGLIGSIDENKHKYNIRYGLSEEKQNDCNGHEYQNPVLKGTLETNDWIAYEEAERILKPSENNTNILVSLRQAMDKSRTLNKSLRLHTTEIKTNAVFALCSYMIPEIKDTLLLSGLFQRMIILIKNIDMRAHINISKHIANDYFAGKSHYDYIKDKDILKLIAEIIKIKTWYEKVRKNEEIVTDDNYTDYVISLGEDLIKSYSLASNMDTSILNSFFRRGIIQIFKIAVHKAVIGERTKITKEDINYAFKIYRSSFDSIKEFILTFSFETKLNYAINEYLTNNNGTPLTDFVSELANITGTGIKAIREYLKKCNIIKIKKGGYHTELVYLKEGDKIA